MRIMQYFHFSLKTAQHQIKYHRVTYILLMGGPSYKTTTKLPEKGYIGVVFSFPLPFKTLYLSNLKHSTHYSYSCVS